MKFAVIGSPVAHSKSPAMHAAAFSALGLSHTYEKLETTEAELSARVDALRRGEFGGLNVTVPHKQRVLSLVDEIAPSALSIGAANTLVRTSEGRVVAHNTDAGALAQELADAMMPARTGVVLGTGGAARAAVAALGSLGARRVVVMGRRVDDSLQTVFEKILSAASSAPSSLATTNVVVRDLAVRFSPPRDVACIIQATSCGMTGGGPGEIVADAIAWDTVSKAAIAIDVVYAPRETPFLRTARAHGIPAKDGLGMLARQGALAFELWLGVTPPLDVMLAAIA